MQVTIYHAMQCCVQMDHHPCILLIAPTKLGGDLVDKVIVTGFEITRLPRTQQQVILFTITR